jgi:hypothetical protein
MAFDKDYMDRRELTRDEYLAWLEWNEMGLLEECSCPLCCSQDEQDEDITHYLAGQEDFLLMDELP